MFSYTMAGRGSRSGSQPHPRRATDARPRAMGTCPCSLGSELLFRLPTPRLRQFHTFANAELLRVERGEHSKAGTHPDVIGAASEGIRSAIEYNSNQAEKLAKLQFFFFVAGALAYVAWHLLEMYARTR